MSIKKRGISPLLATIVLIGFVVIIALLVWFWYSDLIQYQTTKQGQKIKSEFSCASDVEITADWVGCTYNQASFTLKNKGGVELRSFKAVGTDVSGAIDSITVDAILKQGGTLNTGAIFDVKVVPLLSEVQVIPLLNGVACDEKQITLSCS